MYLTSSATRPVKRVDCNRSAMAGVAAAYGEAVRIVSSLLCNLAVLETCHWLIRYHGVANNTKVSSALDNLLPLCGTKATLASRIKRGLCDSALVSLYARGFYQIETWLPIVDDAPMR